MEHTDDREPGLSLRFSGHAAPITPQNAARLVRQAQERAGLSPWSDMEADCFQAGDELLILARPLPARPQGFLFACFEDLLGAVRARTGKSGALYTVPGGYLLSVPRSAPNLCLREFGEEYPLSPDWEIHAREQGQCIFPENAIAHLLALYSTDEM